MLSLDASPHPSLHGRENKPNTTNIPESRIPLENAECATHRSTCTYSVYVSFVRNVGFTWVFIRLGLYVCVYIYIYMHTRTVSNLITLRLWRQIETPFCWFAVSLYTVETAQSSHHVWLLKSVITFVEVLQTNQHSVVFEQSTNS